ncbi:RWD domain-containing protein 4-like [Dendronephthya gigantea]|uniref:RWD domain-containing protein 4-like n=1 Tax=Dendronephthya gigantea TaxID=151771 RepID=UPI00106CB9F0|nr:RWD domain-containing protein 4-like [Dendronephthya gigantea]
MTQNTEQEEELEVLRAIYEEDELFNELNETTFQYRFGESGESKSFLLEVQWTDTYPECLPSINLNAFYNKHLSNELKDIIVEKITNEIVDSVGAAMTFTIFSWVGENFESLIEEHMDLVNTEKEDALLTLAHPEEVIDKPVKEKKVQLTKQQKRKLADRTNHKGERERGWNWVDIVKHLSKTGGN